MGETPDIRDAPLLERLESVVREIDEFRPRQPHHHPNLFGGEASIPFERIFASVARGREAIDLAIGEGLCALQDCDGFMALGHSRLTDYAREELGLPASTAREKARLARGLATRPFLREAVRAGGLSARKALEVLPVARGDSERAWLLLAGTLTVRELRAAVARALGRDAGAASAEAPPGEERWKPLCLPLRPEHRPIVEEAMRLAGELLGPGAPAWQRLEAIAQEFLGWHPIEPGERERAGDGGRGVPPGEMERALEIEARGWEWLEALAPAVAPELGETAPEALDARLRDLVERRRSWDELFGVLARGFLKLGLVRELGFADLGHYARERLDMSRRAVEQRAWLERRLEDLPPLRWALDRGEVCYEKARLVAGVADFGTVHGWIRRARGMTCSELERSIEAARDAQACARGRLEARVPERVAGLVEAALLAAAEASGAPTDPAARLAIVAAHFVATWGPLLRRRSTPERRVLERDGGWCQVPGCSRPAAHAHHVRFRSRGGGDDPANRVAVCTPHHLRGIHRGLVRVEGTAPDGLVWKVGPLRSARAVGPAC